MMRSKVLVCDDDKAIRDSVKIALIREPYDIVEADRLDSCEVYLNQGDFDLLLLDVHFKATAETGIDYLKKIKGKQNVPPIIVFSGAASPTEAAQAIQLGARDFIEKPLSADRLRISIRRCLEIEDLKSKVAAATSGGGLSSEFIGHSSAAGKVRALIQELAPKDIRVLITGETGTGKEVVAQSIWKQSTRADRPLITVNAAAVPDSLLESELFGHKKGAFTGAHQDQAGKLELADRATLFLDEVGELSPQAQSKLLRFLETGEVQRVGFNQSKSVDTRLIAATSRNLEEEVKKGRFREDLFFRLHVARIEIQPLRQRIQDIDVLFQAFLDRFTKKYGTVTKTVHSDVYGQLQQAFWPGNVRELRNLAERIAVIDDEVITVETLGRLSWTGGTVVGLQSELKLPVPTLPEEVMPLKDFKKVAEQAYIQAVMKLSHGSVTQAARLLSIDRSWLHQKLNVVLKG